MNPLLAAHPHTKDNRAEIEASKFCGCCACMEIFSTEEITTYTGLDMNSFNNPDAPLAPETAVCPRCGSEALIGEKAGFGLSPDFLNRMNQAWYQVTLIRKPAPKKT